MIKKLLVANRGEIAIRIIRACRNMGIRSVAIYSVEDKDSLHVKLADQRICIGEGPARNSYLNQESILTAAINIGADAIHPGVGFLSENPNFARLCQEHGVIFIGPEGDVAVAASGVIDRVVFARTTSVWEGMPDDLTNCYAAVYDGALRIRDAGRYTLTLNSDDGSRLWLDGRMIIDNDGAHSMCSKSVSLPLCEGLHDLKIEYFENTVEA